MDPVITPGQTPPVVETPTTQMPSEPKHSRKKKLLLGILFLILFLASAAYFVLQQNTFKEPEDDAMHVRLPTITPVPTFAFSPQKLLYSKEKEIWLLDLVSKNKKRITINDNPIVDISVSPSGSMAAFTYLTPSNTNRQFSYPKTGLKVISLQSGDVFDLIPGADASVRYPTWSADEKYLSAWINEGQTATIYDMATYKPTFQVISYAVDTSPVSPIIFIPGSNSIAYVDRGTLYTADITGKTKVSIAEDVQSTRPVHEGPALPDMPHISGNGVLVTYHTLAGDLVLKNILNQKTVMLAPGRKSDVFEDTIETSGDVIGFTSQNKLIFTKFESSVYNFDKNTKLPFYVYDAQQPIATTSAFIKKQQDNDSNIDFVSLILNPDGKTVTAHSVVSNQGFKIFTHNGELVKDCFSTDFRYNFYNWGGGMDYQNRLKVWSPDGNYLVSESETLTIVDVRTCQTFDGFNETGVKHVQWLP